MRFSTQQYDKIRGVVEVIVGNVGQTGLTPTIAIRRLSDGLYLQNGGGSWGAGYATNNMSAVDASNMPGLYTYAVPSGQLTYTAGSAGYFFRIEETTNALVEHVEVSVERSEWDELLTAHVVSGSFGRALQIVRGLSLGNYRLSSPTFDSEGRMLTATVKVYPTGSDTDADTNALDTFTITSTYDVFGNLSTMKSKS